MPRARSGVPRHRRKKKIMKRVKGFRGGRSKLYRQAMEVRRRSEAYARAHRRRKKGDFRRLWITRLTAAARARGVSYSKLIHALKLADIQLNRKQLSELAIHDPAAFDRIVETARKHLRSSLERKEVASSA